MSVSDESAQAQEREMTAVMSDAYRALVCLHIAVEKHVADDVSAKVHAAFNELRASLAAAIQEQERLEQIVTALAEAEALKNERAKTADAALLQVEQERDTLKQEKEELQARVDRQT